MDTDNTISNNESVGTLADIWIRRKEAFAENLAEQRRKADALIKRVLDGWLGNISLAEIESLDTEQMRFVVRLKEIDMQDNIKTSVIKDAAKDYINRSNDEKLLDVIFEYADGDEWEEFLLLVTKKEAVGGDK